MTDFMEEAFTLAQQGVGRTSPNPAVGAVVVRDGKIIGRGFHTYVGVKHAEVLALEEAGDAARGATVYLTLEPCSHQGRTGPCADALIQAGVSKVVVATVDPNPKVGGQGLARLREAGIAVEVVSEYASRANELNEAYVHYMLTGRPLVTLKAAVTLDGKIAAPEDNQGWITSEIARAHVQQIRHLSDAIITGIGTVEADDCLLTDRTNLERSRPLLRVVLDSQLRISRNSKMVTSVASDLLVATTSASSPERRKALEDLGVKILVADGPSGRTDLSAVIDYLARERCLSAMVEAGSKVNWAMLDAKVVDKVFFYYAPKILGGLQSLPVAGGTGRQRRADAILLDRLKLHSISTNEFAVEAYIVRS